MRNIVLINLGFQTWKNFPALSKIFRSHTLRRNSLKNIGFRGAKVLPCPGRLHMSGRPPSWVAIPRSWVTVGRRRCCKWCALDTGEIACWWLTCCALGDPLPPQALRCSYTEPAIISGLVSHLPTGMLIAAADCNDLIQVAVSVKSTVCESCLVYLGH